LTRSEKKSSGMARYHATVESRRSATETFGYLATFSNAAEWDPGALAGEQLDPGPAGAGRPLPARRAVLGLHMSPTYEVIRCVPAMRCCWPPPAARCGSTDRIVVTGGEDRSEVSYEAEVRPRGPLQALDPRSAAGFPRRGRADGCRACQALSGRPRGPGTMTSQDTPVPSGGAAPRPGDAP
jgi:hypothetical protein